MDGLPNTSHGAAIEPQSQIGHLWDTTGGGETSDAQGVKTGGPTDSLLEAYGTNVLN